MDKLQYSQFTLLFPDADLEAKANHPCPNRGLPLPPQSSSALPADWNVKHRSISGHVGPRPRKGVPLHLLRHRYRHRHRRLRPRRRLGYLHNRKQFDRRCDQSSPYYFQKSY
ncbi:hypothetical protein CMV_013945 [Castanea mollissima]|uniref:Uncharacterized protein n=1 Tax=Castanea mollissima TaxID=60419 RepID=A0A8J4QYL4_9ROSI|nr:hypothetical protein CMV_013945 [Castanea mollissima]